MRKPLHAPRWAWLAMVTSLVAIAVLLPQALDRDESPLGRMAEERPATSEASRQPRLDDPTAVLVVGDGYTAGSDDGGAGPANWTAVISSRMAAAGSPVQMTVDSAVGSGYVQRSAGGLTFADLALRDSPVPFDVVIFFGSESDVALPGEVQAAAAATYERVLAAWPNARLLVVGPAWRGGSAPASLTATSAGVARAAAAAGAPYVDPLAEGWFSARSVDLVGASDGYPNDEGHRMIAARIEPRLTALLASDGAAG